MKTSQRIIFALFVVPVAFAGCSDSAEKQSRAATTKRYELKGEVVAVDLKQSLVTLDHEDVPGLMKAMKMDFRVEDPKLLEGIKAGDQVQGRLKKGESGLVITELSKR
jgi:Cu/Ag efflux protein CusF